MPDEYHPGQSLVQARRSIAVDVVIAKYGSSAKDRILFKFLRSGEPEFKTALLVRWAGKGGTMFFLFRLAFWLALVIAVIPVRQSDLGPGEKQVGAADTFGIARSVVSDLVAFCTRNEKTCATGSILVSQMGLKAREGARVVYTFLDERFSPAERTVQAENGTAAPELDQAVTGAVAPEKARLENSPG